MMNQAEIRKAIAGEVRAHLGRDEIPGAELARRSDISPAAINRKIKGDVSFTVEELLRVEKALGLEHGSLFAVAQQAA